MSKEAADHLPPQKSGASAGGVSLQTVAPRLLGELLAAARQAGEDDDQSPLRIEGYRITGRLGEGGMGVVWRAEQVSTGRPVALKVMSVSAFGSRKGRARFEREVELTARLEHPGIARLYESGICRGTFYYAMELIDGLPLDRYVLEHRLGRTQICRLMNEVCRAVQHAHGRGVIHRDLKPANVLVTADVRPHVLDFGLAGATTDAVVSRSLSLDHDVTGTLGFMSPQQAAGGGGPADTRDDVYGLGAMLFLLLTGQLPHDPAGTPLEVIRRITDRDVPRPRSLDGSIHPDLDAVLLKALAREPGRRYASVGELADDLERHLSGLPVAARPPTLAYFAGKAVRRHRVAFLLAAAFGVALAGVATWAGWRVRGERNAAIAERNTATAQRAEAQAQRRLAEQRLVESLVAHGNAMAQADRWVEAKRSYQAAHEAAVAAGTGDTAAGLGLLGAYLVAPPPLNEYHGHSGPVRVTAVSPDAALVASGGADGTVRVWELALGRAIARFNGHSRGVTCLAFSTDCKQIAAADGDKTIRLWDLATGEQRLRLNCKAGVDGMALSPDGRRLAAICADKTWSVWELTNGRCRSARPDWTGALSVAFSPDSSRFLTGDEFQVYVWDAATGARVCTVPTGKAVAVAVSPDGGRLLVAGAPQPPEEGVPLSLWRLRQDGPMVFNFPAQPCGARRITFAPEGDRAIVAGEDGVLREVNLVTRGVKPLCFGDGAPLSAVGFSADHGLAASGSADGTVYTWDLAGSERAAAAFPLPFLASCLAVSPDGSRLLVGSRAGPVDTLDPGAGSFAPLLPKQDGPVQVIAFSPDPSVLLTGAADGAVRLWQGADGAALGLLGRHDADVRAIACSPDGRLALSVNGNEAKLWNLADRRLVWSRRGGATLAHAATFSADGRIAWAVTVHGRVTGWDVAGGSPLPCRVQLQMAGDLDHSVIFLDDASLVLATQEPEHDVVLWDARTGGVVRRLRGHTDAVDAVAVSPDKTLFASGGRDDSVRIWEAATGKELAVLRYDARPVRLLLFSPDGRRLYAVGPDHRLVEWQLDRAEQYRQFQDQIRTARDALQTNPRGIDAVRTLERWYRFRHREDLAKSLTRPR